MKLAYKVWLDNDGKALERGLTHFSSHVRETGSLHQAAAQMGMSYRKAWLTIRRQRATARVSFAGEDRWRSLRRGLAYHAGRPRIHKEI